MGSDQEECATNAPNGAVMLQIESLMSTDTLERNGDKKEDHRACQIYWREIQYLKPAVECGFETKWSPCSYANSSYSTTIKNACRTSLVSNLSSIQWATLVFFYKAMESKPGMVWISAVPPPHCPTTAAASTAP